MSSQEPRVSVIVPSQDYGRFLPDAIASLQAQTFADWECIVIDDGSTDDTPDIVASLMGRDPRIRYIRRARIGVSAARNAGLAAATAPYVQFLDADDRLEPEKLRVHVEYLDSHERVTIVYGDAATIGTQLSGKGTQLSGKAISPLELGAPTRAGLSAINPLVVRNGLVIHAPLSRRDAIDGVGAFREDMALLEDWELWLRCAMSGAVFAREMREGARALVRVHREGASRDSDRMLEAAVKLRTRIAAELPTESARLNARYLARAQSKLALVHLRRGRRRQALAEVLRAAPRLVRALR